MSLWVPPTVSRELQDQTQAYRIELAAAMHSDRVCADFTTELRKIDPYLELIRAAPKATAEGLRAGYYHVMRNNPGAPPSLMVIEGPAGEFREPDSRDFDRLRRDDMWSERSMKERRRVEVAAARAKERAEQREHEERVEEMVARIKSGRGLSVSFSGSWTNSVDGKRGAKRAA